MPFSNVEIPYFYRLLLLVVVAFSGSCIALGSTADTSPKLSQTETVLVSSQYGELLKKVEKLTNENKKKLGLIELYTAVITLLLGALYFIARRYSKVGAGVGDSIEDIVHVHQENALLQKELEIAKQIQDNLLPEKLPDSDFGFEMAARYIPATHVAGDWFTYHHNPKSGENVIAVADVSGHGVGAAMYTAVIAALFHDSCEQSDMFPMEAFAGKVNKALYKLGKGHWHVTMQIISFKRDESHFKILNAGHPFPIMFETKDGKTRSQTIAVPSMVLGLEPDTNGSVKTFDFDENSSLLMYTDGLIESKSSCIDARAYGKRRLINLAKLTKNKESETSVEELITTIHDDLSKYVGHEAVEDDVCMVAFQKTS